ncbi:MAG: hypothetical protein DDG59_08425 [Anaerolineae bacterium]|jgi:hypothetical protein|nr:MAG: hypothetical protein DDG59_08425 [Anaerolineae bacterium]
MDFVRIYPNQRSPQPPQKTAYIVVLALITLSLACGAAAQLFFVPTSTSPPLTTVSLPATPSRTLPTQAFETNTPFPFTTATVTPNQSPELAGCKGKLSFQLLDSPVYSKDLFEHHAQGTFLILHLQGINLTQHPIQIYSQDYTLIVSQENDELRLKPHAAATNYLYLVRGDSFYQDKIKPTSFWRTYLAFDVPAPTSAWKLLLTPGAGNSTPVCQTTLSP